MSEKQQVCEQCGQSCSAGDMYCYRCGHILPAGEQALAATRELHQAHSSMLQFNWGTAYFDAQMILRLHIRDTDELLEVPLAAECVLGRTHGDVSPDVDLAPYQATELGVSRQHAKLLFAGTTIKVLDLHSANGTFLNGQKLLPFHSHVLCDGDDLRLGHLVLRIAFGHPPQPGG